MGSKKRILIVEEENDLRKLLEYTLSDSYDVTSFQYPWEVGESELKHINYYDAIISDWQTGGNVNAGLLFGKDVFESGYKGKILFISGYFLNDGEPRVREDIEKFIPKSSYDILPKGNQILNLKQKIESLLQNQQE